MCIPKVTKYNKGNRIANIILSMNKKIRRLILPDLKKNYYAAIIINTV